MPEIVLHKYWLPPPAWKPKGKPYLSEFLMTAEDAAERGALRPEPSSRKVIQAPEPGERDINGSFSHLGTSWKK